MNGKPLGPVSLQYARFCVATWICARLIPLLAWRVDLLTVFARTTPPPRTPYRGLPAELIAYRVKRAARRPRVMADRPCLREGVLAYRYLRLAGFKPELHFGVDPATLYKAKLGGHCWVVLDGKTILNAPVSEIIPVLVLDQDSRIQATRPPRQAVARG